MRILCLMYGLRPREWFCLMGKFVAYGVSAALLLGLLGTSAMAEGGPLVLEREGSTISLEPYAPNIRARNHEYRQSCGCGRPGIWVCGFTFGRGMDTRTRCRGVRCVPIRPDGSARGSGRFAERQAAAADAARPAESGTAPTLFWRRWWRERSKRWRTWSA